MAGSSTINTEVFEAVRLKEETALSLRDKVGWVCYTWVYQSVGVWVCVRVRSMRRFH